MFISLEKQADIQTYHVKTDYLLNVMLRMVENEYHFLLVCPLYIEIRRKQSLNRITAIDCTMQIFKYKYIYM